MGLDLQTNTEKRKPPGLVNLLLTAADGFLIKHYDHAE